MASLEDKMQWLMEQATHVAELGSVAGVLL